MGRVVHVHVVMAVAVLLVVVVARHDHGHVRGEAFWSGVVVGVHLRRCSIFVQLIFFFADVKTKELRLGGWAVPDWAGGGRVFTGNT